MKKLLLLATVLVFLLGILPTATANGSTLYVDDDGSCGGNVPCYLHPQDAVNAANPGDTILVYPGTYDSRYFECPWPPNCSCSDNYAPALIVYKDGLTITSVEGPENTTIQSTHTCWSNAIAVQNSTAGGVTGLSGWSPNAAVIVASNVTIEGFTFHRPFNCSDPYGCFWNTAGVFIGSKGAGYPDFLGSANGATVRNNVFSDVWHAVYIWHSSDNDIVENTVQPLGSVTNHWAAISSYDGYNDTQIEYGNLSENNLICHNAIADKGIALGAWQPTTWTSNAGSQVCNNTTTQVGVTYAHGPVIIGCNTGGFWHVNTDKVLRITGIAYNGDTLSGTGAVNLSAQLTHEGTADGSGVEVAFTLDGATYTASTVASGVATKSVSLPPGVYEVETTANVCCDCTFTDSQVVVVYDPDGGFVTGGGWIDSPVGAYMPGPEGTVVVTPEDVGDPLEGYSWSTNDTRYDGYSAFVEGPGTPPLGSGSLEMGTKGSADKAQLFNYDHMGTLLADIEGISYATYRHSSSTNPEAQYPAINMEVDYVGDGSSYTTLVWEPIYAYGPGNLAVDTWQTWDTMAPSQTNFGGGWWSTQDIPGVCPFNCFVDWATIIQNNPDAKIKYGFGVNIGSGWSGGFTGAVDSLTLVVNGETTIYDFEPTAGPTGKATFGFVSKYKRGASEPTGNTEFMFKAADLNFHSTSYDWLVVNQGGTNAQFKGDGTINGQLAPNSAEYRFMLWAGDSDPDTFRIRIWWEENGAEHVVYDNGSDQPIAGGQIVIHTK